MAGIVLFDIGFQCVARLVAAIHDLLLVLQLLLQAQMQHHIALVLRCRCPLVIVAILCEHLMQELCLIVVYQPLGCHLTGLVHNVLAGIGVLVLIHKAKNVRQPLLHNLVVLLLDDLLPAYHAVVALERALHGPVVVPLLVTLESLRRRHEPCRVVVINGRRFLPIVLKKACCLVLLCKQSRALVEGGADP